MGQTNRKEIEIETGAELVEFIRTNGIPFQMTTAEADLLCRYTGWQGCSIVEKERKLYLWNPGLEGKHWEETGIDDIVDAACEYNYSLLQTAEKEREQSGSFHGFGQNNSCYEDLCADEKILDAMFDRTIYGKQLEQVAQAIAGSFLEVLQHGKNTEKAIEKLVQDIKAVTGEKKENKISKPVYDSMVFEYHRFHFKPMGQFEKGEDDFYTISRRLRSHTDLGLVDKDGNGIKKYSYESFYAVSTDKNADIFFCIETGKQYVPCGHELQEYMEKKPLKKKGKAR